MPDSTSHENATRLLLEQTATVLDPAGRKVDVLKENPAMVLAENLACSLAEVYNLAMNHGIWPYRYIRNRDTLDLDEQLRLSGARLQSSAPAVWAAVSSFCWQGSGSVISPSWTRMYLTKPI